MYLRTTKKSINSLFNRNFPRRALKSRKSNTYMIETKHWCLCNGFLLPNDQSMSADSAKKYGNNTITEQCKELTAQEKDTSHKNETEKFQSLFLELRRTQARRNNKQTLQVINNPITSFKRNIKLASGGLYSIIVRHQI